MRASEIAIPKPCPIDLRELVANAGEQFHCPQCDRNVYVLSHMSEVEVAAVIERRQRDNLCVAFLQTAAGDVHFRVPPKLVPPSRLRAPRELLRASALALGVAACSSEPEHTIAAGAPPGHIEPGDKPAEPCDKPGEPLAEQPGAPIELAASELQGISVAPPSIEALANTRAARERDSVDIGVRYCVDEQGRVVDAAITEGDEEVGAILLRTMAEAWTYVPHQVDGRPTRVCTQQKLRLWLRARMETLPS